MSRPTAPKRGDVYWIVKDKQYFVIITPQRINALGIAMAVPIASGGVFTSNMGLNVAISGHHTNGVAVCNQIRSFDVMARAEAGTAGYVETLSDELVSEISNRVVSIIEPAN